MFEKIFESILWNSRLVVYAAVVASLLASLGLFYMTTIDVYDTLVHLAHYPFLSDEEQDVLRADTIAHVVGSVDGYLLAIVMLIFSFGIYELFISEIDDAKNAHGSSMLVITSLDDLKDRLAKVIIMILIVLFFEHAIHIRPHGVMELLYYGVGIAFVSFALYLLHKAYEGHPPTALDTVAQEDKHH
jgi:uncharacterized membrane protein YqhA